jgi:hypothetical protein
VNGRGRAPDQQALKCFSDPPPDENARIIIMKGFLTLGLLPSDGYGVNAVIVDEINRHKIICSRVGYRCNGRVRKGLQIPEVLMPKGRVTKNGKAAGQTGDLTKLPSSIRKARSSSSLRHPAAAIISTITIRSFAVWDLARSCRKAWCSL